MGEIKLTGYVCERCGHVWAPRLVNNSKKSKPVVCPKCKSPYWDKPRKNKKRGKVNEQ